MFKDILSNLWCVLQPCLHFKLVASVKPGGFPQTQQRWWRGPGSAWGCQALRCIGLCCSMSWSSCRRSCLCQSSHLQSCCSSLLLGNPSSWHPQIQLEQQTVSAFTTQGARRFFRVLTYVSKSLESEPSSVCRRTKHYKRDPATICEVWSWSVFALAILKFGKLMCERWIGLKPHALCHQSIII